jgi:hypothetical protein
MWLLEQSLEISLEMIIVIDVATSAIAGIFHKCDRAVRV